MRYEVRFYQEHDGDNLEQVAQYLRKIKRPDSVTIHIELANIEEHGPRSSNLSEKKKELDGEIHIYFLLQKRHRISYALCGRQVLLLYGFDARTKRDEDVGLHEAVVRAKKCYGLD